MISKPSQFDVIRTSQGEVRIGGTLTVDGTAYTVTNMYSYGGPIHVWIEDPTTEEEFWVDADPELDKSNTIWTWYDEASMEYSPVTSVTVGAC